MFKRSLALATVLAVLAGTPSAMAVGDGRTLRTTLGAATNPTVLAWPATE